MNLLLDFLPLLLFFAVFKYAEHHVDAATAFASANLGMLVHNGSIGKEEAPILLATVVVVVATLCQVLVMKLTKRRIHLILWVSLALVVLLGGATVWFNNPAFIKWKPTVAYWTLATVFVCAQQFLNRNLLQEMMGSEVRMPAFAWQRLIWIWVAYFVVMGFVNLYVAHRFSTSTWATFKAFGTAGTSIVLFAVQIFYISKHVEPEPQPQPQAQPDRA